MVRLLNKMYVSYMSAYLLLNLLNELGKSDKMRGLSSILSLFRHEFNKSNNTGARMLDSIYHTTLKLNKFEFWHERLEDLASFTQRYNEGHNVTLRNFKTTSGLSILLHDIISLQDATLCNQLI